jgi:hypothetical protein
MEQTHLILYAFDARQGFTFLIVEKMVVEKMIWT